VAAGRLMPHCSNHCAVYDHGTAGQFKGGSGIASRCLFATSLFYRGGITLRQVAAAGSAFSLMTALVAPMIHAFRGLGIQAMPWRQRMSLIERVVKGRVARGDLNDLTNS